MQMKNTEKPEQGHTAPKGKESARRAGSRQKHKVGAPFGNHNAVGNRGGGAAKGNLNALKHGGYSKQLFAEFAADKLQYLDDDIDLERIIIDEIKLLTLRESILLERIAALTQSEPTDTAGEPLCGLYIPASAAPDILSSSFEAFGVSDIPKDKIQKRGFSARLRTQCCVCNTIRKTKNTKTKPSGFVQATRFFVCVSLGGADRVSFLTP